MATYAKDPWGGWGGYAKAATNIAGSRLMNKGIDAGEKYLGKQWDQFMKPSAGPLGDPNVMGPPSNLATPGNASPDLFAAPTASEGVLAAPEGMLLSTQIPAVAETAMLAPEAGAAAEMGLGSLGAGAETMTAMTAPLAAAPEVAAAAEMGLGSLGAGVAAAAPLAEAGTAALAGAEGVGALGALGAGGAGFGAMLASNPIGWGIGGALLLNRLFGKK